MIQNIKEKTKASINLICRVLQYSKSSFYAAAKPSSTQLHDRTLGEKIEQIFRHHRRRYGYRRIVEDLEAQGYKCAPARVRRLMKERGLQAIQPKSYVPKTSDGKASKPSPNLVAEMGIPATPNRIWAGDITYIRTSRGWRYLAVVIDLYSRKAIGWSLANHMRADLVCDAFRQAVNSRRGIEGVIFHSDRGSQYGSRKFRKLLEKSKAQQSMSARACPYDNAWTESFIGTMKTEMIQDGIFINDEDARTELFAYIESYYNIHRRHSALNYLSPTEFESQNQHKN